MCANLDAHLLVRRSFLVVFSAYAVRFCVHNAVLEIASYGVEGSESVGLKCSLWLPVFYHTVSMFNESLSHVDTLVDRILLPEESKSNRPPAVAALIVGLTFWL